VCVGGWVGGGWGGIPWLVTVAKPNVVAGFGWLEYTVDEELEKKVIVYHL